MEVLHIRNILSELCYFTTVSTTHTVSVKNVRILQVRYLTENSIPTFELTYPNSDVTEFYSDIDAAAEAIENVILVSTNLVANGSEQALQQMKNENCY